MGQRDILALKYARALLRKQPTSPLERSNIQYLRDKPLSPLLKYPGGKASDLRYLRANFPELFPVNIERYFEPFLGGGAVWLAIKPIYPMFVNDICQDLMDFYVLIKEHNNDFLDYIRIMSRIWVALQEIAQRSYGDLYQGSLQSLENQRQLIMTHALGDVTCFDIIKRVVKSKIERIIKVEAQEQVKLSEEDCLRNIEGALKAGYYTYIRGIYNSCLSGEIFSPALKSACFYFLRDYAFSSMFRFNGVGEFNVPYGGISYNNRSPSSRVPYWESEELQKHLNATEFSVGDFENFLERYRLTSKDFLFIDPPYDSDFSTYDRKEFGQEEQKRLAEYLLYKTDAQFLAVMKNTEFISNLYNGQKAHNVFCERFGKKYAASFKNRNDRTAEHLVVFRIT